MKEGDNMQAALKENTATEKDWRERYYEESSQRTKDDIKELKQDVKELHQDIQNIKGDIRALDSKIDQIDLKTQTSIFGLKQEISSLRNEMREKFDGLLWKILLGISAILGAFLGLTKYFAG